MTNTQPPQICTKCLQDLGPQIESYKIEITHPATEIAPRTTFAFWIHPACYGLEFGQIIQKNLNRANKLLFEDQHPPEKEILKCAICKATNLQPDPPRFYKTEVREVDLPPLVKEHMEEKPTFSALLCEDCHRVSIGTSTEIIKEESES